MHRGDFSEHKATCLCERGCGTKLTREQIKTHDEECPLNEAACPASTFGCPVRVKRSELDQHVKACRFEQLRSVVEPLHKKYEESQQLIKDLSEQSKLIKQQLAKSVQQTKDLQEQMKAMNDTQMIEMKQYKDAIHELQERYEKKLLSLETTEQPKPLALTNGSVVEEVVESSPASPVEKEKKKKKDAKMTIDILKDAAFSCVVAIGRQLYLYKDATLIKKMNCCDANGEAISINSLALLTQGYIGIIHNDKDVVTVWDCFEEKCIWDIKSEHDDRVNSVIPISGNRIAIAGTRVIRIWNQTSQGCVMVINQEAREIIQLKDGRIMAGSSDNSVTIFNSETGAKEKQWNENGIVNCMVQQKDGNVSIGTNNGLSTWNLDGKRISVLNGHADRVISLYQHPKGRLISGSADGTVRIWRSGKLMTKLSAPHFATKIVPTVSKDIAYMYDDQVCVFDVEGNKETSAFKLEKAAKAIINIENIVSY
jgi:hypothetical protein